MLRTCRNLSKNYIYINLTKPYFFFYYGNVVQSVVLQTKKLLYYNWKYWNVDWNVPNINRCTMLRNAKVNRTKPNHLEPHLKKYGIGKKK